MSVSSLDARRPELPLEIRLLDSIDQGVVVYDGERALVFWNRRMEAATGLHRDAVLGQGAYELFPFLVEKGVSALIDLAFDGQVVESGTVRYSIPASGRSGYRRSRLLPLADASGATTRVVEIVSFLSEGDAILAGEASGENRVRALATLANGLASRLSNQLGVVLGYAQMLASELREEPAIARTLGVIEDSTRKAFDITKTLFSFARFEDASQEHLRLEDVVAFTVDSFRLHVSGSVALDLTSADELPMTRGNEAQIREALLHVVTNAEEAVEGLPGGRIAVRVDRVDLTERLEDGALALPAGAYVRVAVEDNGPGIPVEIQQSVRKPFFTTKGRQRLGLGLNVVENTLKACGGATQIRSSEGAGTTVELYFPSAE